MKKQVRPQLKLEITNFQQRINQFRSSQHQNNVIVKPLRSAKNIHELNTFDFHPQNVDIVNTERKLRKLRKLEEEREKLMHSLQILKESAVSAIAEKADEIQRLKAREPLTSGQKLEYFENELYHSQKLNRELKEQREELENEFSQERSRYVHILSQKQDEIEELHEEIIEIRRQLDNLGHKDALKTKKIKLLVEQNNRLNVELQEKSLSWSMRDKEKTFDYEINPISSPSLSVYLNASVNDSLEGFMLNEADKNLITDKLQETSKQHKEELHDLRAYYERRITYLRDIYLRQLLLPNQENQKQRSFNRSRSISKASSRQRSEKRPYLNIKDIYAIEEQAEGLLEASITRNDLKHQIKMQELSECPNMEFRMKTEESDAQSQFTIKYFQNPFQFTKKNHQTEGDKMAEDHEVKTMLKLQKAERQNQENIITEQHEQTISKKKPSNSINKTEVFTMGVLSGVALASVCGLIINKLK